MDRRWTQIALLFLGGTIGGFVCFFIGLPMPFMLGGIAGAGIVVAVLQGREPRDLRLPPTVRRMSIALVGTMIGASFTPDLLAALPAFWVSAVAILVFIPTAQFGSYLIMRRIGGYRPQDAFFSAMPGGLVEASLLGERVGADVKTLTIQHFIRVLIVVVAVPLLFWLVTGQVVGSASGQSFAKDAYDGTDIALIVAISVLGLGLGSVLRLPAAHLMGPMVLAAIAEVGGLTAISSPAWLLFMAQLVIGVGLGAQFSGLTRAALLRGLTTGLISVAYMMAVTMIFAFALIRIVPAELQTMFLAFAPGGVTEMNLIALSLNLSPAIVAAHHLIRILAAVWIANYAGRWLFPDAISNETTPPRA